MKKMLPVIAMSLLFSLSYAEEAQTPAIIEDGQVDLVADESQVADVAESDVVELTADETEAIQRISNKISDRYIELNLHNHIEEELQKVADKNREDFDIALALRGVDAQDADGNIVRVIPVPAYYIIR